METQELERLHCYCICMVCGNPGSDKDCIAIAFVWFVKTQDIVRLHCYCICMVRGIPGSGKTALLLHLYGVRNPRSKTALLLHLYGVWKHRIWYKDRVAVAFVWCLETQDPVRLHCYCILYGVWKHRIW